MRKFAAIFAATVIAAISIASAAQKASAATIPSDDMRCYYKGFYCSYPGTAYWFDCNPDYGEGFIRTDTAAALCRSFHGGTAW